MNTIMLHEQELITKEHIRNNTYKFNTPIKQTYIWCFISKEPVTVATILNFEGGTYPSFKALLCVHLLTFKTKVLHLCSNIAVQHS